MAHRAGIRCKQAGVQEGRFLQFLRSVGYRDELPPSTVAWLDSAPVFKFLATKLSADNFVSPGDQQEYNELMLARGPDASLYDAVDGLSSDAGDDEALSASRAAGKQEADPFLAGAPDEEVASALEAEEAHVQQLEQQVAALRGVSAALGASAQQQAEQQGSLYFMLKAQAANQLAAVRAEAQQLDGELNATLQQLEAVAGELCSLIGHPQLWLLCCAPDRAAYEQLDAAANDQYWRATQLLDTSEVTMQLHAAASPAAAMAAAAAATDPALQLAAGGGGIPGAAGLGTPHGATQQQQPLLTPRGGQAKDWTAVLQEAQKKRREAHAARNAALMMELCRQRQAFALALRDLVAASVHEAGLQAQLAAAHQVRSRSGEFGALLRQGPAALGALGAQLGELQEQVEALRAGPVAELALSVARLNDNHVIVGDYDRQIAKMDAAYARRQAVLHCLLQRASSHMLLLLLGCEELGRLATLGRQLHTTAHMLEGHVAATEARVARCVAAYKALDDAKALANLRPQDTYLSTLLAAVEGRWCPQDEQGQEEQQPAPSAGAGAGEGQQQVPRTPAGSLTGLFSGLSMRGGDGPGGARTPSYAPSAGLADKLQQLAAGLQRGAAELQRLLGVLPQHLEQHRQAAAALHATAFPPGQPMYVPGSSSSASASAAGPQVAPAGTAPPSAPGSTWGGSQSAAAASGRSGTSSGTLAGGGPQHRQPLLVLPEVAEAEGALDAGLKQLQQEANRAITRQNERVKALGRGGGGGKERELERRVMALFFTNPGELAAGVEALAQQVRQQAADQDLGPGGGGADQDTPTQRG